MKLSSKASKLVSKASLIEPTIVKQTESLLLLLLLLFFSLCSENAITLVNIWEKRCNGAKIDGWNEWDMLNRQ